MSDVGTNQAPEDFQLFSIDEANKNTAYETNFQNRGKGSQKCRAIATLYEEKDGEAVNQAINDFYWKIAEGSGLDIETGYRIWFVKTAPFTKYAGGVHQFNITPNHPEITKDEPKDDIKNPGNAQDDENPAGTPCSAESCDDEADQQMLYIIVTAVVIALLIILLSVIIVCCCCCNR